MAEKDEEKDEVLTNRGEEPDLSSAELDNIKLEAFLDMYERVQSIPTHLSETPTDHGLVQTKSGPEEGAKLTQQREQHKERLYRVAQEKNSERRFVDKALGKKKIDSEKVMRDEAEAENREVDERQLKDLRAAITYQEYLITIAQAKAERANRSISVLEIGEIEQTITKMVENDILVKGLIAKLENDRRHSRTTRERSYVPYYDSRHTERVIETLTRGYLGNIFDTPQELAEKTKLTAEQEPLKETIKPEIIDRLNDEFLKEFLEQARSEREKAMAYSGFNRGDDYTVKKVEQLSEANLEQVKQIITNYYSGKKTKEEESLTYRKIDELMSHTDSKYSAGRLLFGGNHVYTEISQSIQSQESYESQAATIRLRIELLKRADKVVGGLSLTYDIESAEQALLIVIRECSGVDVARLEAIAHNQEMIELLGADKIERYEVEVAQALIEKIKNLNTDGDERTAAGRSLMRFTNPKIIPMVVLNAYVEPGHSGGRPLLEDLPDYCAKLSEEEMYIFKVRGYQG